MYKRQVLDYFDGYGRLGPEPTGPKRRLEPGETPPQNVLRRMLSGVPMSKREDREAFRKRMLDGLGKLHILAVDGVSGQRPLDGGRGSAGDAEEVARQVENLIKEALDDLVPDSHKEDLFSRDHRRRGLLTHLGRGELGHRRVVAYASSEDGQIEQPLQDKVRESHLAIGEIKPNSALVAREVNRQIMKVLRPDHGTETLTTALDESFDKFSEEDRALVEEALELAAAHMPASWVRFVNRRGYTFEYSRRAVHRDPTADRNGSIGIGGWLVGEGAVGKTREERLFDGVRQIIHEIGHALSDPDNGDHDLATGHGGRGNLRYVMAQAFVSSQLSDAQLSHETDEILSLIHI